jgi:hypothetical protein
VAAVASASAEVAGSVFESTTAQAALLAVFNTAQGIALLPNIAAATPKFVAASTFAAAAAMSFAGVGGSSLTGSPAAGNTGAGAGAAGGSFGPSSLATETANADQVSGTTIIMQFADITGDAPVRVADILNDGARRGRGITLDAALIEGMGG